RIERAQARNVPHCTAMPFCTLLPARRPPALTLFPYTTLFRSLDEVPPPPPFNPVDHHLARVQDLIEARFPRRFRCAHPSHPGVRSAEHTSELQSRANLVCRLVLEK